MIENGAASKEVYRFGIGEWYGRLFTKLTPLQRRELAQLQLARKRDRFPQPCPPRLAEDHDAVCTKEGGVCSIRLYRLKHSTVSVAGELTTTCPYRFNEANAVFEWVGRTVLGDHSPVLVREIGFLEKNRATNKQGTDDVGRIDMVLVHPEKPPLRWCALEMQAVYFSGDSMRQEFESLAHQEDVGVPFPVGKRRPDFRSSGPKRLMPQLQIKVPTLRRWGKKMAVVVDHSFFDSIGSMDAVDDLSNSDIAWFVVRYKEVGPRAELEPDFVRFTTLERTVEGLTGGTPVALQEFERRIEQKLSS